MVGVSKPLDYVASMFGLTKPRPPLTTFQRVDIELLMRKTIETVGADWVKNAPAVTSIDQLAIDSSTPQTLLDSASAEVRGRLNMPDVVIETKIVDGRQLGYPSTYQADCQDDGPLISIADDTVADPLRTVMELAYQYSLHFWRSQPQPTPLDTDPRTTNLLPVCCGLGILASDASLYDNQWSQAGWSGWSISRSGYYNAVELGYALALWARARGETKPAWNRALRPDSKVTAGQAWRYFAAHKKSGGRLLFDAAKIPGSDREMKELGDWLGGRDLAFALAAGYALSNFDELPPLVIEAALDATRSGDKDLVPVAVRLLAGARHDSAEVIDRVCSLIRSDSTQTSLAAIQAADALGIGLIDYSVRISKLLDALAEDAFELLKVIGRQGDQMGFLEGQICQHTTRALKAVDGDLVTALLQCLSKITSNPQAAIERNIRSPQLQQEALEHLEKLE